MKTMNTSIGLAWDARLSWDALTLLEQYFHREQISHELFICVRSRLQKHLFDAEQR
jgi:hypothetical protein